MFYVDQDAGHVGIGVVLTQEGRPIGYYSEKLNGFAILIHHRIVLWDLDVSIKWILKNVASTCMYVVKKGDAR